ncbi:unnamed protein product [Linum trigynum]
MYGIRNRIFTKYKDLNDRMNHPPPKTTPSIWRKMVHKWDDLNCVETSAKNKENQEKSELAATAVQYLWPSTYMMR